MPYKNKSMKSQRQKERRKGEAPTTMKPPVEVPNAKQIVAMKALEVAFTLQHPVMKWLIPGEKREKMEAIVQSLKKHNQLHNVYLGCGVHSLPLDIVGEMLEVTG